MIRFLCLALGFMLILAPLRANQRRKPVKMSKPTMTIRDQVMVQPARDRPRRIGGMPIDVDVHEGVATLKGKVRNDKQKSTQKPKKWRRK